VLPSRRNRVRSAFIRGGGLADLQRFQSQMDHPDHARRRRMAIGSREKGSISSERAINRIPVSRVFPRSNRQLRIHAFGRSQSARRVKLYAGQRVHLAPPRRGLMHKRRSRYLYSRYLCEMKRLEERFAGESERERTLVVFQDALSKSAESGVPPLRSPRA